MLEIIQKMTEPESLNTILSAIALFLYLTGRITKKQFMAEQKKSKGIILPREARNDVSNEMLGVIGTVINGLDKVPVLNTKLPLLKRSLPQIAKFMVTGPLGILSDIVFNIPVIGNKVKAPNRDRL